MADPAAPDVTRRIHVFARSEDNYPLLNSEIEAFIGDVSAGKNTQNNGQATMTITGPPGPVKVVVRYEDKVEERLLAEGQENITIDFSGVRLGLTPEDRRAEARMAFFKDKFTVLLGVVMLIAALALVFTFDKTNTLQEWAIRVTISLAAGGIASGIPGTLGVNLGWAGKLGITAGGALAVLAMTFLVPTDIIERMSKDKPAVTAPANNSTPSDNDSMIADNLS